jgi:transcription antitermination factor NusG
MTELAESEDARFWLMFNAGTLQRCNDAALEPLRTAETAVIPKRRQHNFTQGETVRAPSGIFAGMDGEVIKSERGKTRVSFAGMPVEFPTSFLRQGRANELLAA